MSRIVSVVLLGAAACALSARADTPSVQQTEVERQLRQFEKEIEKVRELKFKKPVVAHVIPRPAKGAEGVQGYYDTKKKALFLYDDVKGNYAKGVLVHEMVHALQDQHFGLAKLHSTSFGSDQELALAALIEGDATLTMIELLKKEQPHAEKMLLTDLSKAKNLQNAFLYGAGARFVSEVKRRGGWKAVDQRYRFRPTSTAAVLHPGERITAVNLGPGKRLGEFGLVKLLHGHETTRAKSVSAAAGWRGDRLSEGENGSAWVVAFATEEQARRFFDALTELRRLEYPKQARLAGPPDECVLRGDGGQRGVYLRGPRVWEVTAKDEKGYREWLDRLEGPPRLAVWSAKEKKALTFGEFLDRLQAFDLICVGETHDSEDHHRVQLMILKGLFARDERLGVGMEMFQRPFQRAVDRYISGATDEATFLEDSEYRKRWGYDWGLYRPIVEFCRRNRVPLAALNLPDELRGRLSKGGYEKLPAEDKGELGQIDFQVKAHRSHWFDRLGEMHGQGEVKKEDKERTYQVMTAWDEYMADSAARFQQGRKLRRMVVLAGSGHVEHGFGIPDRAARRTGGKAATVTVRHGDPGKPPADPPADFVVFVQ
ncbi:MAG: ChaN family lipoprotein [Gemmataceae bacterium]